MTTITSRRINVAFLYEYIIQRVIENIKNGFLYFGDPTNTTLQILSVALVGAVLSGSVTYCLNIPLGLEKINLSAAVISAIINITLNIFALPIWKHNGAAFTTVISEFFVVIYCIVRNKEFKDFINRGVLFKNGVHALIGCISISIIACCVHYYIGKSMISLVIIICISVFIYFLELVILKNELVYAILRKIFSRS